MSLSSSGRAAQPTPLGRPARSAAPIWVIVGIAGWAGVVALGMRLYDSVPPRAGFDLEVLLAAGRRVAQGLSAYEPAMLAGQAPSAEDLFYSYPPPVAQYLSLFASVSSTLMLIVWGLAAAIGLLVAAIALARVLGPWTGGRLSEQLRTIGLPVLAVGPFVFPFAIAILFGNLDAAFPLLYGLMLVGVLGRTAVARFAGGAGLAVAAIAKVGPAAMALWFLVRGLRDRRRGFAGSDDSKRLEPPGLPVPWRVLVAGVAVGLTVVLASVVAGGIRPWFDYLTVLRAGSGADVVDVRNIAPASQLGLLLGGSEGVARPAQIAVTAIALVGTVAAAWFPDDVLESFGWATVASLVVLPVAWFHYPVALVPVAIAAWLRANPAARRSVLVLLGLAVVVGIVSIALPVSVWLAVALVLVAVRRSAPGDDAPAPLPLLEPSRITRFPVTGRNG